MARAFSILGVLVGAGLTLGFGYLTVDSALDLYAFPKTPRKITLAELSAIESVPRGTWVRLDKGDLVQVAGPAQPSSGGPNYLLLSDSDKQSYVVVTFETLPSETETSWTGVPSVHSASARNSRFSRLPHALTFPEVPLEEWAEPHITILWTHSGPKNALIGVAFCPLMVLVGLFVLYYYSQALLPARSGQADVIWASETLPMSVRLSPLSAKRMMRTGLVFGIFALVWLASFTAVEYLGQASIVRFSAVSAVGLVLLLIAGLTIWRARQLSGNDYFAKLVWLPVVRSYAVRARGIDSGATAYELAVPPDASPRTLTAHSGGTSLGLVFRDASRSEVLCARPLQSTQIVVLTAALDEIAESPLAPLSHPRRHLVPL